MKLYATITKIDEDQRMVFGYASTEALDSQGEIVKREALEAALPDYMRFANIREMHQASAVGVATDAGLDDRGLHIAAKIVDPIAWDKVVAGVYKGFSIGGQVVSRDQAQKHIITGVKLSEISLVDRPSNPEAVFTMYKAEDGRLAKAGARNSAADLEMIQDIHDGAVALGASCDGCDPGMDGGDDDDGTAAGKIAGLTRQRDALLKALARASVERKMSVGAPAERKASVRAVPIEKSADRGQGLDLGDPEPATSDPVELTKRALRRPMTLAQIEKLANH